MRDALSLGFAIVFVAYLKNGIVLILPYMFGVAEEDQNSFSGEDPHN